MKKLFFKRIIIIAIVHKPVVLLCRAGRSLPSRTFFLETRVQAGNIRSMMNSRFLPGRKDLVRIFKTVLISGQNRSFTGLYAGVVTCASAQLMATFSMYLKSFLPRSMQY